MICVLAISIPLKSQPSDTPEQNHFQQERQIGLLMGMSVDGTLVSENMIYEPVLVMLYGAFPLKKKSKGNGKMYVVTEPQFNFFQNEDGAKYFDAGVNLGLQYRWYTSKGSWFFTQISSGPHYVSFESERQAGGFIFSDNFATGLSFKLTNQLRTSFQYRFRHLSNASLKRPNRGINNHFLMFEVVFNW